MLSAIPWNYCMGGIAYGLPFPVYFPSHGESEWFLMELEPELRNHGRYISPFSILGNCLVSLLASFVFVFLIKLFTNVKEK